MPGKRQAAKIDWALIGYDKKVVAAMPRPLSLCSYASAPEFSQELAQEESQYLHVRTVPLGRQGLADAQAPASHQQSSDLDPMKPRAEREPTLRTAYGDEPARRDSGSQ